MALFKRGKTWWTDFSVNGMRFRLSLETTDWREAQSREKEKISQASAGKLAPSNQQFARLALPEAVDRYLADRRAYVAPLSHRSESDHARPLCEYFGTTAVARISAESILAYIRYRKEKGISNTTVNMEIGILRRVLKRAKRWYFVGDEIPHLPERKDIGRALAPDEKLRLLRIASTRMGDCLPRFGARAQHDNERLRVKATALEGCGPDRSHAISAAGRDQDGCW
jgi:hypothetical protein